MRIIALQGSPRPEGNTQALLEAVLTPAREKGAEVEVVHLSSLPRLTGCRECFACQDEPDDPGCHVDDDLQTTLEAIPQAEVVVLATPVFCWSPAWPLKIAMDRMYCMFKFDVDGNVSCLLEGKRIAAVITAGAAVEDGADLVEEACRRMAKFSNADWRGAMIAANTSTPQAIQNDETLHAEATLFGQQLIA
jgi:multimeric flavodoxin WrbA